MLSFVKSLFFIFLFLSAGLEPPARIKLNSSVTASLSERDFRKKLSDAALIQVGQTKLYDPAYRRLSYPGGDIPLNTGVCSDVIIRAYRAVGIDLQKLIHEDMRKSFRSYPQSWGLRGPDSNIDHRRVPNLMRFFKGSGQSLKTSSDREHYLTGDIVAWDLGGGVTHIGIIRVEDGTPLVIHNIGKGAQQEDVIFHWKIIGHYYFQP